MVTRRPRLFSSRPREEAVNPFPRLDATPPVTKMCLATTTSASREPRPGARDPPRRCAGGHGGTPPNLPRRAATRRGWRANAQDGTGAEGYRPNHGGAGGGGAHAPRRRPADMAPRRGRAGGRRRRPAHPRVRRQPPPHLRRRVLRLVGPRDGPWRRALPRAL